MKSNRQKAYTIYNGIPLPPIKAGRTKSINNDEELVGIALKAMHAQKYKSYMHAAKELEKDSKTLAKGNTWRKLGSSESIINRLMRKISKAHKLMPTAK